MFYFVKSLFKVNLQNYNVLLGMMANVQKLKSPGYTILYSSSPQEAILVFMYQTRHDRLESAGDKLSYALQRVIKKGNRSIIIHTGWIVLLWYEGNMGRIDATCVYLPGTEIIH